MLHQSFINSPSVVFFKIFFKDYSAELWFSTGLFMIYTLIWTNESLLIQMIFVIYMPLFCKWLLLSVVFFLLNILLIHCLPRLVEDQTKIVFMWWYFIIVWNKSMLIVCCHIVLTCFINMGMLDDILHI